MKTKRNLPLRLKQETTSLSDVAKIFFISSAAPPHPPYLNLNHSLLTGDPAAAALAQNGFYLPERTLSKTPAHPANPRLRLRSSGKPTTACKLAAARREASAVATPSAAAGGAVDGSDGGGGLSGAAGGAALPGIS